MTEIDIPLPSGAQPETVIVALEDCCAAEGLQVGRRSSLARYPGCVHWHWKRPRMSGTLEITLWPAAPRLWISVHTGRAGAWTANAAPELQARLEAALGSIPAATAKERGEEAG